MVDFGDVTCDLRQDVAEHRSRRAQLALALLGVLAVAEGPDLPLHRLVHESIRCVEHGPGGEAQLVAADLHRL